MVLFTLAASSGSPLRCVVLICLVTLGQPCFCLRFPFAPPRFRVLSRRQCCTEKLRLDVREFGKEAARLGVDASSFPPYERLLEVVEAKAKDAADASTVEGPASSR